MVVLRDESLVTPERRRFARALWWLGWLLVVIALAGIEPLRRDFNFLRSWEPLPLDWNHWTTQMWLASGIRLVVIGGGGVYFIAFAKMMECRQRRAMWRSWSFLGIILFMVVSIVGNLLPPLLFHLYFYHLHPAGQGVWPRDYFFQSQWFLLFFLLLPIPIGIAIARGIQMHLVEHRR